MTNYIQGFNPKCVLDNYKGFSFYSIKLNDADLHMGRLPLLNTYQNLKNEFIFGLHGNRGISELRYQYDNGKYAYSCIVFIKDENEVIFKLKYETARLLYVLAPRMVFDIYIDDLDEMLLTAGT